MIRLGGPVFEKWHTPQEWAQSVKALGYRAAFCPLSPDADDETVRAFATCAKEEDIVIAEVGAWSNPLSHDDEEREKALLKCKQGLSLADRIGASCCVNISGSCSECWDGPAPLNLTPETFDMIVDCVREIIDDVQPVRTFYTLETMPWMYPDSVESYLDLIHAIDRYAFGVHLDPVNLICSPQRYFANAELIRDSIAKLGPWLKSCHAKDILLQDRLTVHLDEVRLGLGGLDYGAYLTALDALPTEVPLLLEHLAGADEYALAADAIRSVASTESIYL